ncbi:hypothetical protein QF036_005105 [Arthrobacter globiformis]|nr:hypothetical protein [Arthrobacter globiformis]
MSAHLGREGPAARGRSAATGRFECLVGGGPPYRHRSPHPPGTCGKPWPSQDWAGPARGQRKMLAGLAPMWASTPLRSVAGCGARARRRRAPDPLALSCLRRFGCCPDGLYVSAPAGLAPVPQAPPGPAVREMSLRRSFVADFLREFPAPCPEGRQASVGHSSASFASSQKQRGRGEAGRSPLVAPPTNPFGKKGATP